MLSAAALAATACWLALGGSGADRLPEAAGRTRDGRSERPPWLTAPWFAGVLAAFAVTRVVPGWVGLAVGTGVGLAVARWVGRLEPESRRRRREAELAELPLAIDLVVAAVGAGRPTAQVLDVVAEAVGGPLGERLDAVLVKLELGSDPVAVWRGLVDDPVLAPLARAFARASRSGSAVGRTLGRASDDLRAVRRAAAVERARAVGVRTAAPLGACFLPAFLLLGVVPTVAATFSSLHL